MEFSIGYFTIISWSILRQEVSGEVPRGRNIFGAIKTFIILLFVSVASSTFHWVMWHWGLLWIRFYELFFIHLCSVPMRSHSNLLPLTSNLGAHDYYVLVSLNPRTITMINIMYFLAKEFRESRAKTI